MVTHLTPLPLEAPHPTCQRPSKSFMKLDDCSRNTSSRDAGSSTTFKHTLKVPLSARKFHLHACMHKHNNGRQGVPVNELLNTPEPCRAADTAACQNMGRGGGR